MNVINAIIIEISNISVITQISVIMDNEVSNNTT
jgi:hypothetical protein